ncbi:MAG: hypothetical protein LBL18_00695, partial [Bacteroidales bacterium]|nr:hypothetical protein [Bacteroidales bacterium]
MARGLYRDSKAASILLSAFLFLSFFDGEQFFFDVGGLSIRPFYLLLPVGLLLALSAKYQRREFGVMITFPLLFAV